MIHQYPVDDSEFISDQTVSTINQYIQYTLQLFTAISLLLPQWDPTDLQLVDEIMGILCIIIMYAAYRHHHT